jgi:hypothetical protein
VSFCQNGGNYQTKRSRWPCRLWGSHDICYEERVCTGLHGVSSLRVRYASSFAPVSLFCLEPNICWCRGGGSSWPWRHLQLLLLQTSYIKFQPNSWGLSICRIRAVTFPNTIVTTWYIGEYIILSFTFQPYDHGFLAADVTATDFILMYITVFLLSIATCSVFVFGECGQHKMSCWRMCWLHCKIWGFHGCDYEERRLLGCYVVWLL